MPKGVSLSAMTTSPDGQGVILFGGMPDDDVEYSTYTAILELRYISNEFPLCLLNCIWHTRYLLKMLKDFLKIVFKV